MRSVYTMLTLQTLCLINRTNDAIPASHKYTFRTLSTDQLYKSYCVTQYSVLQKNVEALSLLQYIN